MNVYIYDDFLNKSKYNRTINRLEIKLTDLGLNGKIVRLGAIKNIHDAVESEIKNGAKTIVAVGNNETVFKVAAAVIEHQALSFIPQKTLFFIIPVGKEDNSIANSLGIKREEEACNTLLARRIKKIDIGVAGRNYFIEKAEMESEGVILEIDGFTLEIQEKGIVSIINLSEKSNIIGGKIPKPNDGKLDIHIKTKSRDESFLSIKSLKIISKGQSLFLDDSVEVKTPIELGVIPSGLEIVVGKERSFE
ncbi:MAG: diacylglycerol kinase family protein [Patescibacteria group bacterium]